MSFLLRKFKKNIFSEKYGLVEIRDVYVDK